MKKIIAAVLVVLITLSAIPAFANSSDEQRRRQQKINNQAAEYMQRGGIITPKLFKNVDSYIKRNFPEHWNSESAWVAAADGFRKAGRKGYGYLTITWTGKVFFNNYWIADWYENGEVY